MSLADDLKLLRACITEWDDKAGRGGGTSGIEDDGADEPNWYQPFCGMLGDLESGKWSSLTERQSAWVRGVHERLFDQPTYENLFSSGKAPRGNYGKSPTPEVLLKRPLKPPGGRA